jgi:hypothetical protein
MRLSILGAVALATAVIGSAVATGCDGDDDHSHSHGTSGGGHTSSYPDCNAIIEACHEVDVGEGPIHDCHDKAHAATSEADCTPIKDNCLAICSAAKNDAGGGSSSGEDSGTHGHAHGG